VQFFFEVGDSISGSVSFAWDRFRFFLRFGREKRTSPPSHESWGLRVDQFRQICAQKAPFLVILGLGIPKLGLKGDVYLEVWHLHLIHPELR
jgi:hypothetical protein